MQRVETCERTFWTRNNKEPREIHELSERMKDTLADGWEPWALTEVTGGIGADAWFGFIVYFKRPVGAKI